MTEVAASIGISKPVLSFIICGDRPVTGILHSEHLQTDGREMFEAGYPRLPEFLPYRDPGISSAMSRRLMGS